MIKLYDKSSGITRRSLEFWAKKKAAIGKISKIECSFEPIERIPDTHNGVNYFHEYNLILTGEAGQIVLSGCNCSYGGEGPNGTRKILEELGVPHNRAVDLMFQPSFCIELAAEV